MGENRRDFLKKAGLTALGLGIAPPILATLGALSKATEGASVAAQKQLGMVIDIRKCRNAELTRACAEACRREHNIPVINDPEEEVKWIWTESFEKVFEDQQHAHPAEFLEEERVLVLCNHCTSPACVRVCPTKATWKRKEDGIVMMDMHRCIGCRYCMAACPYGARSFNWRDPRPYIKGGIRPEYPTRTKGVVEKCTFCAERLRDGLQPACVEAAERIPGGQGALVFGNVSDPKSEISRVLRENYTISRRPSVGTGPNVYYIV